jgi:hypothetical protein
MTHNTTRKQDNMNNKQKIITRIILNGSRWRIVGDPTKVDTAILAVLEQMGISQTDQTASPAAGTDERLTGRQARGGASRGSERA